MAEYSAALNTVVKWEKEFSCELEKVITNGKVTMIKCSLCKKFEGDLNKLRSYTTTWVEGTKIALLRRLWQNSQLREHVFTGLTGVNILLPNLSVNSAPHHY